MKWLQSLKSNLKKKRSQAEASADALSGAGTGTGGSADDELVPPLPAAGAGRCSTDSDTELPSRPKRRSVSVDLYGSQAQPPQLQLSGSSQRLPLDHGLQKSSDRRASLEQWQEARRQRNSLDAHGTISTDKLTICKAAGTTIVNKTYVTIKHLGSGTFGRVMLCFNVYDHRLYAIKFCRKSQFSSGAQHRHGGGGAPRRRRGSAGPGGAAALTSPAGGGFGGAGGGFGGGRPGGGGAPAGLSVSGPLPLIPNAFAFGGSGCSTRTTAYPDAPADGQPAAIPLPPQLQMYSRRGLGKPPGNACDAAAPGGAWRTRQQQQQQQQFHTALGLQGAGGSCGDLGDGYGAVPPPPPPRPPPPVYMDTEMADVPQPAGDGSGSSGGWGGSGGATGGGPAAALDSSGSLGANGRNPLLSSGLSSGIGPGGFGAGGGGSFTVGAVPGNGCFSGGNGSFTAGCGGGSSFSGSVFQEALARFQTEEVVKEIAILKKLSHPNIVNLIEVIDDPAIDSLLLVMEYVEGGTLQPGTAGPARWRPVEEGTVWDYTRQVLQGLDYLHANHVVHGDLKPANLLLDSNSRCVKIADFGSSIIAGGDKAFASRGGTCGFSTPAFRSPESLTSGYQPSFEMDMWALGVCVYIWTFGELPFAGAAPFIIYDKIRSQDVTLPVPQRSASTGAPSHELLDFMGQLLQKDATRRLTVAAAMRHHWITRGGASPLPSLGAADDPAPAGPGASAFAAAAARPHAAVKPSQDEIDGAIRPADAPPLERVGAVFSERRYRDGEVLVAPGDPADCIFLIATGEVEIVAPPLLGGAAALGPLISAAGPSAAGGCGGGWLPGGPEGSANLDLLEAEQGLQAARVDIESSPSLLASVALLGEVVTAGSHRHSHPLPPAAAAVAAGPGAGAGGAGCAGSAAECGGSHCGLFGQQLQQQGDASVGAAPAPQDALGLASLQREWDDERHTLAVKGPGDSLGLPSSTRGAAEGQAWRVFCRARGEVKVFAALIHDLRQLAARHPEMEPAVRQIATQQETDMAVAEAMRRLRIFSGGGGSGDGRGGGAAAFASAPVNAFGEPPPDPSAQSL